MMKIKLLPLVSTFLVSILISLLVVFTFINKGDFMKPEIIIKESLITEKEVSNNEKSSGVFVVLGDSISSRDKQCYGKEGGGQNKGYQQFIKEELDMASYINLGISGATIARGTEYLRGLSKIAIDYSFGDIDFIIVQAGTNDFALNVPLGRQPELTRKDPNRYNFYGAYAGLIQDLKRNNEGVDIYLITPTQRDCKNFGGNCINEEGLYLKDYVNAIKETGEYYNIPVIDMYENIRITQESIEDYTTDGLHLNDEGYKIFSDKFIKTYKELNTTEKRDNNGI